MSKTRDFYMKRILFLFWNLLLWIVLFSALVVIFAVLVVFLVWNLDVVYALVPFWGIAFRLVVLLSLFCVIGGIWLTERPQ